MWQIIQNEADEDIIGIVGFDLRVSGFQRLLHLAANIFQLFLRLEKGAGSLRQQLAASAPSSRWSGHGPR